MRAISPSAERAIPDEFSSDPALAAVLASWRSAGRALVTDQFAEFNELLEPIEPLIQRRRYAEAAAAAQVAANYAVLWHTGLFASRTLERLLQTLGEAALPMPSTEACAAGPRLRVLHVASRVAAVGGHTRMLWRWIDHDNRNMHSVALTRQTQQIPRALHAAVAGRIRYINRRVGGLLGWARSLQAALAEADLVVLHVDNQDVIPFLALAGMGQRPPVVLVNHADHMFWLGVDFVDLVVSTRLSGHQFCVARRGVEANRNVLLPLCLDRATRQASRRSAKSALGLPADSIVLLTVARSLKFRAIDGLSFADDLLSVLRADKRLRLVAVGPGGVADWSGAEAEVPGQILTFGERSDTAAFFDAADAYVDSFPFSSITSLLEAGLRSLPLVTRYPFGPGCEIMGADSLGLDSVMVRARSVAEFRHELKRLVADSELRAQIGARTRASIEATNTGEGWGRALASVYDQALRVPTTSVTNPVACDRPHLDDVDLFLPFALGLRPRPPAPRVAMARELGLKTLPFTQRLGLWARMVRRREFGFRRSLASWRYLVPEWITVQARITARQGQ
jgi:hypothetical protein